jgi:hypothetical protein
MSKIGKKALIGRCGLYCGACVIYRAERDDPELRKRIAKNVDCPPEKVRCRGCGALTPDCWGYECRIVICLNERQYRYCYECLEYEDKSCEKFESLSKGYLENDGVDLRKDLAMIKAGRTDEWLKIMVERYSCPACGRPVSVGSKKCPHCEKKSGHNSRTSKSSWFRHLRKADPDVCLLVCQQYDSYVLLLPDRFPDLA